MKSEEAPIISVVIACYNQGIYLSDALNSLEKQTFQNWEGIIVNDGSTDGTEEIALEYVKKDERFKYVFQEKALSGRDNQCDGSCPFHPPVLRMRPLFQTGNIVRIHLNKSTDRMIT